MIRPPRPRSSASRTTATTSSSVMRRSRSRTMPRARNRLDCQAKPPLARIARYVNETIEGGESGTSALISAVWAAAEPRCSSACSASFPHVCALGEVVHLWQRDIRDDERCGCGARFSGCDFWRLVGRRRSAAGTASTSTASSRCATRSSAPGTSRAWPPAEGAATRGRLTEYASYYAAVYRAAAPGHRRPPGRRLLQAQRAGALPALAPTSIDLRVAHVVRDARGVAYSWTKTVTRPETDGARGDDPLLPRPLGACCGTRHNAAFGLLARRGVPVRRLRYEDFLADPRGTRARARRVRRARRRPAPTRCTSWRPARRPAPSGTAPPATRCASPPAGCRCAATTPGVSALPPASGVSSARSALRCCAPTATAPQPRRRPGGVMNWPSVGVVIPTRDRPRWFAAPSRRYATRTTRAR